ncbi:DNA translocase FtsK [Parasulfitobacter algicola]|uniref:DNA translocase FtsK n=1 Tax=Parasulfitobacter algicola TaxID=2614809 RepID=A0ABX2ILI2_9RHOB|nr:DNA translocase FtsK [Sulfitobacter algicola]NSX53415.1 DNA translocase FtsK 4TM domain-containing protein [Sulfitobacter algicola]
MAYQTRGRRDPLLDSTTQAALEKRGKELLGMGLLVFGALVGMMLWSYSPNDPSFMMATDEPVQNWLGRFGAMIAAPLMMIIGYGLWVIVAVSLTWGVRFALHRGEDRAIGRLIFFPILIAVTSLYASTLIPPAGWTHSFDLGGLFGEAIIGIFANLLPFSIGFNVKLTSVGSAVGMVALGLFVLGFTRAELRVILRFLIVGLVVVYAQIFNVLRGIFNGAKSATHRVQQAKAARRDAAQIQEDIPPTRPASTQQARVLRAEPAMTSPPVAPVAQPVAKPGLLARIPGLMQRPAPMPEPELIDPIYNDAIIEGPSDERIQAKISDAVKSRRRQSPGQMMPRIEPSLTRGKGPQPLVLSDEPPVVAPRLDMDTSFAVPDDMTPLVAEPTWDAAPVPETKGVVQHPARKPVQPSKKAKAEAQPALKFDDATAEYEHPPLSLLTNPVEIQRQHLSDEALEENARMLENVLDDYGVKGEIVSVRPGPVVTMYELEPAPGLKASRVIGLSDDIARSMSALSARVSTVPGRSVIGIELPNATREKVVLREILSARGFGDSNMRLPLALGKDIGGEPIIANLSKMPHLLIAGTTGSGKSVAINTMILSLLYKLSPEECRMIMIDPKMLELSVYDGIPHLLSPVVTDPKKAVVALKWVVGEMEERYRKMSKMGVRNIEGYNGRVRDALSKGEMFSRTVQTGFDDDTGEPVFETEEIQPETIPYIVVIVDEMADLMMVAGKEIEACIQRLAQMARASGIHLIMATQRPSVDVITGTIKANFPTRISFQVTSKIDSRTILGEMGAEQLLGMGDMLYMAGGSKITRIHGPFCSDEEVEEIVNFLKANGAPEYVNGVVDGPEDGKESDIDLVLGLGGNTDGEDALYDQAVQIVIQDRKCSTSYIQRKLAIGYNKAARLVEQMEDQGLVSSANHVGKREILIPEQ